MAIQAATPYLMLNGKAAQAMALYERAFGARVQTVQRFGDVDGSCPAAMKDRIMHAELKLAEALVMLSDGAEDNATEGGRVSVALGMNDETEARRAFDALAAGGTTIEPLGDAPWGALFGVVVDEFGVSWMFNCTK